MQNQQQHLDLGFSGHCLLWIVLTCKLCQNPAKELPGSHSPTSALFLGSCPAALLPAEQCPAVELHRCHPQAWDAQCVCPEVLLRFCPSCFSPIPSEEQAAGQGRLGPQTPHFQVVCFPQAARGRGHKPLSWVAQGQLGQKVRQGDIAGMWAGHS